MTVSASLGPVAPAFSPQASGSRRLPSPWVLYPSLVTEWAAARGAAAPARSGDLPVARAANVLAETYGVTARSLGAEERVAAMLARAQVCPRDLAGLARRVDVAHLPLNEVAAAVRVWLYALSRSFPDMAVRDALGWLLVCAEPTWITLSSDLAPQAVRPWVHAGLGAGGWVYAAAGFTPAEVVAARDAETLTEDHARALAALRGAPLPL